MERERIDGRDGLRQRALAARRDAHLGRVSGATKAAGVATVAAVGVFGIYVSRTIPGHSTASTTNPAAASSASAAPAGSSAAPAGASAGSSTGASSSPATLAPPSAPPVRTVRPPVVVSGAS